MNKISIKWIQESDWRYETAFDLPDEFDLQKPLFLVFERLDTVAEIILNGEKCYRLSKKSLDWNEIVLFSNKKKDTSNA